MRETKAPQSFCSSRKRASEGGDAQVRRVKFSSNGGGHVLPAERNPDDVGLEAREGKEGVISGLTCTEAGRGDALDEMSDCPSTEEHVSRDRDWTKEETC